MVQRMLGGSMFEIQNITNNETHGRLCGTISEAIDAVECLTGAVFCELWEVYETPEASGEPTIIYTGYRAAHNQPTSVAHLVPADTDDLLYGYPYWEPVIYYDTPPEEPIFGPYPHRTHPRKPGSLHHLHQHHH